MRLLLDTQIIYWWMFESARVPTQARTLIEQSAESVLISRASQWEMAIKISKGKLKIDLQALNCQIIADGFSWLPIEDEHVLQVTTLPVFDDHKDPFDRLLVAQSLSEPLILLTTDVKLARYGSTVRVV
ncbi:MAG: type II toxin-antitoxin system VapC family toxin [Candidatus Competibacteraceae bacterium]|nr:MAG: type II toxin-antitoxin system VapC family toxin [Candidatus Competibacteraceae bacterium]